MNPVSVVRRLVEAIDRAGGRALSRGLGALCVLAGSGALFTGVLALRNGFAWALVIPLAAGLAFLMLGRWLWRSGKRLSEFDWSGM